MSTPPAVTSETSAISTTPPIPPVSAAASAAGLLDVRTIVPDAVIDLICFTSASARQLIDALRPSRALLVHCGTIWVHGRSLRVPVTEDEPRTAYGAYGTGKAEIEALRDSGAVE